MKDNNIKHIRVLYALFASILLICLGLFVCNVVGAEERPQMAALNSSKFAFTITDLRADGPTYTNEHVIKYGMPEGVEAHTHINRFDVDAYTDKTDIMSDGRLTWIIILQSFELLAIAAIVVLVVIALIAFYRSAKRGQVFPAKRVSLILIIGILLVVTSLCHDTGTYLERQLAFDLLKDTDYWVPQTHYTIHFTRIFFGLTLIFLSQIIRIGRELQDDQELTV